MSYIQVQRYEPLSTKSVSDFSETIDDFLDNFVESSEHSLKKNEKDCSPTQIVLTKQTKMVESCYAAPNLGHPATAQDCPV